MKKLVAPLIVLGLLLAGSPAHAGPKDPKPRVRIIDVEATGDGPEGTTTYNIRVAARDPNGIVSEIALEFGDGATVWLLLACTDPGDTLVQDIEWSYPPGKYVLRSWGYSTSECFSGSFQESRVDRRRLKVR